MSNPANTTRDDLEKYKFVSTGAAKDEITIKVTNADGSPITVGASNPFAPPFGTVSFTVTWSVGNTICDYKFYDGPGGSGTLLQTVTLTYSVAQTPDLTGGDIT